MMCDADVCRLIPTTRLKRVFEWGVKQAPREAPDSECWGPSFGPLRKANIFQKGPKSDPLRNRKWSLLAGLFLVPSFCQMCWSFASCYVRKMSSLKLLLHKQHPWQESWTVRGPGCQLVVAMMCDADVCPLIPTTRPKRVFEWGVKQAPREAPDSECWGPSFGPLRKANIFQKGPKSGPS